MLVQDRNHGHSFLRDNTNGGLVVDTRTEADGCITHTMEEGHSYRLTKEDQAFLERMNFTPRLKEGSQNAN